MRRALVTGGTGYLGRELVAQLLRRGDDVTILSRSQPRRDVRWFEGDIVDGKAIQRRLADTRFDVVYHLASLPGDTGDPRQMIAVNMVGLSNMLEFARRAEVSRFVLSSSISAYEWFPATKFRKPLSMPVAEDHPCRPQDMYSSTKRMQEILTETYYHQFGLPTAILRVTAVVGPHGSGGGTMWREFAVQLRDAQRVQLPMFSAEELSHFVDIRDAAAMHVIAAEHPAAAGQTFNCCAARATRGSEFAACVTELAPGAEVAFGFPWSMAQGGEIEFDMSKAKRLLGFEPKFTLRDAVRSIHEWAQRGGLEVKSRVGADQ